MRIISEIRLLGQGLGLALAHEGSISVCGYSGDLAQTIGKIQLLRPDLVLLNGLYRVEIHTGTIDVNGKPTDAAPTFK